MTHQRALLLAHIAIVFMGLAGVFAVASGFDAWLATSYRVSFGGAILLLFWCLKAKPRIKVEWRRVPLFLLLGGLLGFHWFTFFKSMNLLGVMLGSAMIGSEPLMITLLAALFLAERLTTAKKVSLFLSLIGFAILGWGNLQSENILAGLAWSLLSFFLFSSLVIIHRYVMRGSASTLFYTAIEMIGAIPVTLAFSHGPWLPVDARGWLFALILGIPCTALAHGFYNASIRVLSAPVAGILLSLEVVYGMLGGWIMGDSLSFKESIAALFIANILLFDLYEFVHSRKKKSRIQPVAL